MFCSVLKPIHRVFHAHKLKKNVSNRLFVKAKLESIFVLVAFHTA